MHTSGFTNTPISRALVFVVIASSVLATITDTKHYFHLIPSLHLSQYHQYWRILTWQACYTNSTEVLFAGMIFYQMRIIERLWGSRKFASFLTTILLLSSLVTPLLLSILQFLPYTADLYLPAGPTTLLFALLAQYRSAIPNLYTYRIGGVSSSSSTSQTAESLPTTGAISFTDKSTNYFLPLQLALSQFPNSVLPALVGWVLGLAWRSEVLPGTAWRVPAWVVGGGQAQRHGPAVEALRRRIEEDGEGQSAGSARDTTTAAAAVEARRRRVS